MSDVSALAICIAGGLKPNVRTGTIPPYVVSCSPMLYTSIQAGARLNPNVYTQLTSLKLFLLEEK